MSKNTNIPSSDRLPEEPLLYALQSGMRETQKYLGFTQEKLAQKLHISRGTVINLENGSTKLRTEIAIPYICFLESCCYRRPWVMKQLHEILQKHTRDQNDRALFLAGSFIEIWERHFPTEISPEVELSELFASMWLRDFFIDPLTVPSAAYRKLEKATAVMAENNLRAGYLLQSFTALQIGLSRVVENAPQDAEAAAVKAAMEQLQQKNLLILLGPGSSTESPDDVLADYIRNKLMFERRPLAVLTGSERLAEQLFQWNRQIPIGLNVHVFRYDAEAGKIIEWLPDTLQAFLPPEMKMPEDLIEIGGCQYPVRPNPYLEKE